MNNEINRILLHVDQWEQNRKKCLALKTALTRLFSLPSGDEAEDRKKIREFIHQVKTRPEDRKK
ncbi:hypothetical protein JK635_08150 [Neobacillus sp. YIM B02564]|uniref:Uncharacterized protein n=1 Tax=Neobacillus paridis TaxID=2803862 RepID=A0ABS1TNP1_9BACI|nr:hypothetical protein [Neobacillus paridis]MBL4952183.1 hypothetical protein [Neobacillus paridis]